MKEIKFVDNKVEETSPNTIYIMQKHNSNAVSQLSSALKQVNISNPHVDTLPSNVQFHINGDTSIMDGTQNSNDKDDGNHDSNNEDPADITGQTSRITDFFQNQPMDGYTLFSHRSAPNGYKVAIVLSELNLKYNTFFLDFTKGEHRAPEFIAMNPNARVPALIDHSLDNLALWESGAILLHLVNKNLKETGRATLWSEDLAEQSQITSWIFFQTSGHAPMIGQALHFKYFHTQKFDSAIERYTNEVRRVYSVVEMALSERREALVMELDADNAPAYSSGTTPLSQSKFFDYPIWLVGDKLTIADLCFVPWNNVVDRVGVNIKLEFPEVYKWTKNMMKRPAVNKAFRGE